tara:strand:+ start:55 stop:648 length:594 start_codon:yes stop_codon:yes gene_type:complete
MAELQLGGKTIATQTGSAAPVITSNVNLENATFPAGHVIQTVSRNTSNATSATNTNYVSTDVYHSITTKIANSKILCMINTLTGGNDKSPRVKLTRTIGSTTFDIGTTTGLENSGTYNQTIVTMLSDARLSSVRHGTNMHLSYLDSPSSSTGTSIEYRIFLKGADSGTVWCGRSAFSVNSDDDIYVLSSVTLMEIAP